MSVTAETSQNPIGPCGPLEHLLDTFRHSTMANRRSALNFGGHAVVGYYCRGVGVMVRVTIMIRFAFRVRVALRDKARAKVRGLGSGSALGCKAA